MVIAVLTNQYVSLQWDAMITTCTHSGVTLFNSLGYNKIGDVGAESLGEALRVNHSLKALK